MSDDTADEFTEDPSDTPSDTPVESDETPAEAPDANEPDGEMPVAEAPTPAPRKTTRKAVTRIPEVVEVLSDPKSADQFFKLAEQLTVTLGPVPLPTATAEWDGYLGHCRERLGVITVNFALGIALPEIENAGDTVAAVGGARFTAHDLRSATEAHRKRLRAFAEKLMKKWDDPEPVQRMAAVRIILCLVAVGAWPESDRAWIPFVLAGVRGMADDNAITSTVQLETAAASLGALSMSVARANLPHGEHGVMHNLFDQTAKAVAHLLVAADPATVGFYAEGLRTRYPIATQTDVVMGVAQALVSDDPLDAAVDALAENGIVARTHGVVLDLPTSVPDPRYAALRALGLAQDAPIVAIRAHSPKGWVNIVWRKPDVVIIQNGVKEGTFLARRYKLTSGAKPSDYSGVGALNPDHNVESSIAGQPLLESALELLRAAGLDAPGPPQF